MEQSAVGCPLAVLIVTPATKDTASSSPLVSRDITVGGILGLVLGFGLALISTHLSPFVLTRGRRLPRAAASPVIAASIGNRRFRLGFRRRF